MIFRVAGVPAPQGSFRAVKSKSTGKAMLKVNETGGFLRYRADVRAVAEREMRGPLLLDAVHLTLIFVFPRPEGHWLPANSRRAEPVLRPGAPANFIGSPDLDKLCRSVGDALTGVVYKDDAQVSALTAVKMWSSDYGFGGETTIVISDIEKED